MMKVEGLSDIEEGGRRGRSGVFTANKDEGLFPRRYQQQSKNAK